MPDELDRFILRLGLGDDSECGQVPASCLLDAYLTIYDA
jgi:hypothetical protein